MCPDCEARRRMARDAWLNHKMGEAASHVIKGVAEAVGIKPKTGAAELKAARRGRRPKRPEPAPAQTAKTE